MPPVDRYGRSLSFGRGGATPIVHDPILVLEGRRVALPSGSPRSRTSVSPEELPGMPANAVVTLLEGDRAGDATVVEMLSNPTPTPLSERDQARSRTLLRA